MWCRWNVLPSACMHRLPGHSTLIPIPNDAPGALNFLGRQEARHHKDPSCEPSREAFGPPGSQPFIPRPLGPRLGRLPHFTTKAEASMQTSGFRLSPAPSPAHWLPGRCCRQRQALKDRRGSLGGGVMSSRPLSGTTPGFAEITPSSATHSQETEDKPRICTVLTSPPAEWGHGSPSLPGLMQ